MNTSLHKLWYLTQFLLEQEMFQKKSCREKQNA